MFDKNNLKKNDLKFIKYNAIAIYKYLHPQSNPILWNWGAHNFEITIFKGMAALRFVVNGFKHKGKVYVCYDEGSDLYEINLTDEKDKIIQTKEQIFCDQLTDTIDEMVETDNDKSEKYINKVNKYLNDSFCKN